ncbi:hypothetical protein V8D89_000838 [Ganoderma adspersum]
MSGEESPSSDDQTVPTVQLDQPSGNARPITSSLPQELFVQIFREVYRLVRKEASRDQWATNWSSPYQLVCRSWRDVIRSTPSFWGFEIRVSRSPEWLEVCLERCAGSPAVVFAFTPYEPLPTFTILRRYASCIAECHLSYSTGKGPWLEGLSSFLSTPLPILDTLSINAYYEETANISFTHDLLPQLLILTLDNCIPPSDAAVYASLRAFRLSRSPWQISYADFLGLLSQCRNLESLMIEGTLLDRFLETVTTSSTMSPRLRDLPVVLPSLQVLRLCGAREVLFDLLGRLHAPLVTTIATETFVDHAHPSPHISQLIAPDIQLRHPLMCRPTEIFIRCKDGDFKVSLRHGENYDDRLLFEFTGPSFAWNTDLEPNIVAAIDTFSFDLVDTLYVDGVLEEVRANVWHRAFQACRNLRVLHLSGRGTLHSVWQGLWGDVTLPSSPCDGLVCCPLLTEIVVNGYCDYAWTSFSATPTLFELMWGTLRARADQYGTRLKTLKMSLRYHHELWNDTTEHDAAVEVIRDMVEEFDYDSVLAVQVE